MEKFPTFLGNFHANRQRTFLAVSGPFSQPSVDLSRNLPWTFLATFHGPFSQSFPFIFNKKIIFPLN